MMKVKTVVIVLLVLVIVGVGLPVRNFIVNFKIDQPQMFADPIFDFIPPEINLAKSDLAILVFSKTNGFRHHEAIPAANNLFLAMADEHHWAVYTTENGAVFNARQLAQFDLVVWNNVTGPALTDDQKSVFEEFVHSGGGYLGIHASGDGSHKSWPWYVSSLIKSQFTMHPLWPQIQTATLNIDNETHPVVRGLPAQWSLEDEWYSFKSSVRDAGSDVLLTIDEDTYDPNIWDMGDDHPLAWAHSVGRGRVVYLAPGHTETVYKDTRYKKMILNAIKWIAGD